MPTITDKQSISLGQTVTVGLATHNADIEAWLVVPSKGVTHVLDAEKNRYSHIYGGIWWKLIDNSTIEMMHIAAKEPIAGTIKDIQETDWGSIMYLVELADSRERWFADHLIRENV